MTYFVTMDDLRLYDDDDDDDDDDTNDALRSAVLLPLTLVIGMMMTSYTTSSPLLAISTLPRNTLYYRTHNTMAIPSIRENVHGHQALRPWLHFRAPKNNQLEKNHQP